METARKLVIGVHSLTTGGSERVASVLLAELAKLDNLELHLVIYGRKRDFFYHVPPTVNIHVPDFHFEDFPRWLATIKTILFIRKTLCELSPSAVVNFGERWNNFVLLACLGTGLTILVSDRCRPDRSLGLIHNCLRRWLYPHAKAVIAQTQYAKDFYLKEVPNARLSVIPNPILIPEESDFGQREPLILSVGRLIATKNYDRLIRIFHQRRDRDWKLAIVGDDPLSSGARRRLRDLCDSLGESENVALPGTVSDVASWYRRASIFAFTSSSEGFPNALAEAMSHGLPCIAYDCIAGPSELITSSKLGFLIKPFDDVHFAETLDQLVADKNLRWEVGAAARASMIRFESGKLAKMYLELSIKPNAPNVQRLSENP